MKVVFNNSILACVFRFSQCDNKEVFIEKIKEMDVEMQQLLVPYIQEVRFLGCKFLLHLFNIFALVFGIISSIIYDYNLFSSNCKCGMNSWSLSLLRLSSYLLRSVGLFVSNFVPFCESKIMFSNNHSSKFTIYSGING